MSLQVWMPLTQDLRNQGLSKTTITNNGATFDSNGKLGGCYVCNGTSNFIDIGYGSNLTVNNKSIALWFKPITVTNSKIVIGVPNGSNRRLYIGVSNSTYNIAFGNKSWGRTTTAAVEANTWVHLAVTVINNTCSLYCNGEFVESITLTTGFNLAGDISFGGRSDGYYINGSFNDIRIYDHCLSESEIKRLAQGLIIHYPLNRNGWGCENMMAYDSECTDYINLTNSNFSLTTEDGIKCAHATGALQTTARLTSKVGFTPQPNEYVTFSAWIKIKNIVRGSTNPMCEFYFSGQTIDDTWRGVNYIESKVDGRIVPTGAGFDKANLFNLNNEGWHYVSTTARYQNYEFTSTLYPSIYLRDCTGDMYVHHIKFERGQKATPWCPHVGDALATTMGLNSTTEYDISGNGYNAIQNSVFTHSSDTPKYTVSTVFDGTTAADVPTIYGSTNKYQQLTIATWIKRTSDDANYHYFWRSTAISVGLRAYNGVNNYYLIQWNHSTADAVVGGHAWVTTVIPLNTWVHSVWVFDSGTWKHYVNGVQNGGIRDNSNTGTYICGDIGGTLNLGKDWVGQLSDFRIYATALSADDVKSLYQNCATIGPDGTIYGQIRS